MSMNEIEEIADRLVALVCDEAGVPMAIGDEGKKEFLSILRDLRGVKVVLPRELTDKISNRFHLQIWQNVRGEFAVMLRDTSSMKQNAGDACAITLPAAIAALAEKITKEKG